VNAKSESRLQSLPQRGAEDAIAEETGPFLEPSALFRGYSRLLQLPPDIVQIPDLRAGGGGWDPGLPARNELARPFGAGQRARGPGSRCSN